MCGILITCGVDEPDFLQAFNSILHRGPYNVGHQYIDGIGIGMVQLPMKQENKDVVPVKIDDYYISYNGEIYEDETTSLYSEAKYALGKILCAKSINGMFAIAAYDSRQKEIFIARDEFGIKPIYFYYNKSERKFIAASEILPILMLIGPTHVNKDVIAEVVALGTQMGEPTCFLGINLLEPNIVLRLEIDTLLIKRYSMEEFKPNNINNFEDMIKKSVFVCADTFRQNALLLSEGLDSNLLLNYLPKEISKFNVTIDNNNLIQDTSITNLSQCNLNMSDAHILLGKAIMSYGQPCRMSSILMYQILSEHIYKNCLHMVITGEGADEVFWGYPRHRLVYEASNMSNHIKIEDIFFKNMSEHTCILEDLGHYDRIIESLNKMKLQYCDGNFIEEVDFFDRRFSLEPLLRRSDHILMQNTIETRVPFLHFGIPYVAKHSIFNKVTKDHTKFPLVQLMKKKNSRFRIQEKQHFRAPLDKWFNNAAIDKVFNLNQLEILSGLGVSIDKLRLSFYKNNSNQIFTFMTMVVWYEQYKKYLYL